MSNFVILILVSCLVLISRAEEVKTINCAESSPLATLHSVSITPCKGAPKGCALKRGTTPVIEVKLTTNEPIQNVTSVVHGIMAGVPIPFPLPNPHVCTGDHGISCPIQSGTEITYRHSIPVLEEYPEVRVVIQWQMKNEAGEDIACFRFRAKITS